MLSITPSLFTLRLAVPCLMLPCLPVPWFIASTRQRLTSSRGQWQNAESFSE
jgi:hypothetical protein